MSDAQASFDAHQNDFDLAKSSLEDLIEEITELSGADRHAAIARTKQPLKDAQDALESMGFTKANLPFNAKQPANEAYKNKSDEYDSLVRRIGYLGNKRPQDSDAPSDSPGYDSQRSRMLQNNERLGNAQSSLNNAERLANETLNIGGSTLQTVREQREQIEGVSNNLYSAERPLDNSLRNVRGMERRRKTNKLIMYAIISVLVLLIIFVIASKFR